MNATLSSKQSRRVLIVVCAILLAFTAFFVALGLASIPEYYTRVVTHTIPTISSLVQTEISNATVSGQAAARGMDLNTFAVYNILLKLVFTLGFEFVAALVILNARGEWFRWYTAFVLAFIPTAGLWEFNQVAQLATPYTSYGALLWPGILLYLYLFPNGKAVPRWTRWPMGALVLIHFVIIFGGLFAPLIPGLKMSQEFIEPSVVMLLLGFPFILVCQIVRYLRVSTLTERLQTRWVLAGLGFFILSSLVISVFTGGNFIRDTGYGGDIIYLLGLFLPVTIGISVLRYRLFDIDVIIRKTLVYAVVIGLLGLVYIGGIVLLQEVIAGFGVRQSPAAIVLSTLAIAVLFNLGRRWFRPKVDRLFFRHKYDAEQALTAFSAQTRDDVDMERISAALLSALEETVQPVRVSLWLEAGGLQPSNSPSPSSGVHQPAAHVGMMEMDIAPDDPLRAHLLKESGVIEIEALELGSAALHRLKEAGVKLSSPLISQGELIGVLNLGPRRSEQGYSSDDGRMINNLAIRAAPALRVAQLVHQQQFEARRRERIEQELRVARLVQETLLPKDIPSIPGWELAARWLPAREMSGDFYDFLPLPDGRLGLIIGDVAGKGMPAALVMAIIQSILRATAERMSPPAEVLERANNLILPRIPTNMFATCLYMILDPISGCLQFANAGHNLSILQTDRGVVEPRATGMPLGLLPGMTYDQNDVQLTPGNRMLMYTDGLVEAHNPQGEMFGIPYLHELVGQEFQVPPGSSGGAALIELLLDSLAGFTGSGWEQEDDVTLVTLDYLGSGLPVEDPAQTKIGAEETFQTPADFKLPGQPSSS